VRVRQKGQPLVWRTIVKQWSGAPAHTIKSDDGVHHANHGHMVEIVSPEKEPTSKRQIGLFLSHSWTISNPDGEDFIRTQHWGMSKTSRNKVVEFREQGSNTMARHADENDENKEQSTTNWYGRHIR
jgi:hypothetical protein